MCMSSFLLDIDQNNFVCGYFLLPSDIDRSIIYVYHRKYLNIVIVWKLVTLWQFPLLKKIFKFSSFFKFMNI